MPYNSSTSAYERRAATVIDATPDGDTVAVAIDVKLDQGIDDYVSDLNHHNENGNHFPETSVGSDSRFLRQSPAGVVSWANGVVAADAALKDFSNVAAGAIASDKLASVAPAKIAQDSNNRFVTDTEKSTWNGALYDKGDVEAVLTGEITSHTHSTASESAAGLVELATTVEAAEGTDTSRAVTAAGVDAYHKAKNINLGVSVAASGTAVDFVGIPEGVKRITVMFDGVSTNGTSPVQIQVGSTTFLTSGYAGGCANVYAGGYAVNTGTTGFVLNSNGPSLLRTGVLHCVDKGSFSWCCSGVIGDKTGGAQMIGGVATLPNALDRLRITTVNGTDQFDAGTINISWEF